MASRDQSRLWRICRVCFRRLRLLILVLILIVLGAIVYLNQVGLPEFVKKPLLDRLREQGVELQFTRIRLRWDRGIVAENVEFGRADGPSSAKLSLKEVAVQFNYRALARLRLQVDALALHDGRLFWSIAESDRADRNVSVENIQSAIRFLPGDRWSLDAFQARFAGANIRISGSITNASAIREWQFLQARDRVRKGTLSTRLSQLADTLDYIQFSESPELRLDIRGDARDLQSFAVRLDVSAPDADTPWGTFQSGLLTLRLLPAASNEVSRAEVNLEAASAQTQWAQATNLHLAMRLVSFEGVTNSVNGDLTLEAHRVETRWGHATNAHFAAQWTHSLTNPIPLSGEGNLRAAFAETRWGRATRARVTARLLPPASGGPAPIDASWAWWTNLAPHALDWECHLAELHSPRLETGELFCTGQWRAPELKISRLDAQLYDGAMQAQAELNVATRELSFAHASDFDAQRIFHLLTPKTQRWLAQFSWHAPPTVRATGAVVLPAWTNREPDWRTEVQPTLRLQGFFHAADCAFREVAATSAQSHFSYTNMFWRLPDLLVLRPEGRLELAHEADDRSRDYYWRIHSSIDPRALRPLLEVKQQRVFDFIGLTEPPVIDGELWGRWYHHERIGGHATVALTNFSFRGQSASGLQTSLEYTNGWLKLTQPRIQRENEQLSADVMEIDFEAGKIHLTNGFAIADPLAVARAIGPKIGRTMEPYQFAKPPAVHVNGVIPLHDERLADLHFDVNGGPFAWMNFRVPQIVGSIHWVGEQLSLRNVRADFYNGSAQGWAEFDFTSGHNADFQFDVSATDADLHALMSDLSTSTNHLEGRLSGRLRISEANSADWQSWQGWGNAKLRDGLVWEIPLFGVLSPALDAIIPGLGSSRASEGSATFTITNGVIRSEDLEVRAPAMRLQYRGTVDLEQRVDARVEAELLRDAWVIGRLVSLVLWPITKTFEYKVTGTLSQPKSEPVYFIPRIVQFPFHPLRSLKEMLPEEPGVQPTNAPPAKPRPAPSLEQ